MSAPFYELARIYKKIGDNVLAEKNIKEANRLSSKKQMVFVRICTDTISKQQISRIN